MRILVIEDEKNLNNIIVKKLVMEKYGVDSCFNGDDALDYIFSAESYSRRSIPWISPRRAGYYMFFSFPLLLLIKLNY